MKISMKKKLVTMALSGAVLASGLAAADGMDLDPKVYVGAEASGGQYCGAKELKINNNNRDITVKRTDNKSLFGNKGAALSGFIGARLNQYFGLEGGYSIMSKPKTRLTDLVNLGDATDVKTKISNGYIDAMGFIPVYDKLEAIGSLGVGFLSTSVAGTAKGKAGTPLAGTTNPFNVKSTKAGVRLGAGLGYKFDENIGARFMVRHQQGNKQVKSITSAGLGLFYQF